MLGLREDDQYSHVYFTDSNKSASSNHVVVVRFAILSGTSKVRRKELFSCYIELSPAAHGALGLERNGKRGLSDQHLA